MFKWKYTETVMTNANASQVWEVWADINNWPCWDNELEWVKLDGAFSEGSNGVMKPRGAPVVKFVLFDVVKNKSFSDRAKLPLTNIEFIHVFDIGSDGKGRITHRVEMSGLLAPLFGKVIGSKIRAHLRYAMERLSDKAENISFQKI